MVARHLVTAVYFLAGGSSGISAWWIGLAGSQLSKSWTALISSDICRLFSISRKVSLGILGSGRSGTQVSVDTFG